MRTAIVSSAEVHRVGSLRAADYIPPEELDGLPIVGPVIPEAGGGWLVALSLSSKRLGPVAAAGWRLTPSGDHTILRPPVRSPEDRVRAYRSKHRITPTTGDYLRENVCAIDELRIYPRAGGGWRHDPHEVEDLIRQAPTAGTVFDR